MKYVLFSIKNMQKSAINNLVFSYYLNNFAY